MKTTTRTIEIQAYMDDDGKPVCGRCFQGPMDNCNKNNWNGIDTRWDPGPSCPVWGEGSREVVG